jgi:YegS/Rv2252/BmrU family lipid kinase
MARRVLLIVNRKSRTGAEQLEAAEACLRAQGLEVIALGVDAPREIPKAIQARASEIHLVALGGGDGTLNVACEAILDARLPFAILPLGTANDLARTLGIPFKLEDACAVAAKGLKYRIDLGRANGKYFFNVASIGLSVAVARSIDSATKRRWGPAGYALTVMSTLGKQRPFRARIRCDGRLLVVHAIQVAVGNGRHYGGGMTVAADAAIDDNLLHLYSISPLSLMRLLLLAPALRTGWQGRFEGVHRLCGTRIDIDTRRPFPVSTDGEVTTQTPVQFEVVPAAIEVMVPPEYLTMGKKNAAQ